MQLTRAGVDPCPHHPTTVLTVCSWIFAVVRHPIDTPRAVVQISSSQTPLGPQQPPARWGFEALTTENTGSLTPADPSSHIIVNRLNLYAIDMHACPPPNKSDQRGKNQSEGGVEGRNSKSNSEVETGGRMSSSQNVRCPLPRTTCLSHAQPPLLTAFWCPLLPPSRLLSCKCAATTPNLQLPLRHKDDLYNTHCSASLSSQKGDPNEGEPIPHAMARLRKNAAPDSNYSQTPTALISYESYLPTLQHPMSMLMTRSSLEQHGTDTAGNTTHATRTWVTDGASPVNPAHCAPPP